MRKFILPIVGLGVLYWLHLDGFADSAHIDLRVQTRAADVVVTETADGSHIAGSPSSSLQPLSDPGQPQLPFRVVRVLLPAGQRVAEVTASVRDRQILASAIHPVTAPPMDGSSTTNPTSA